MKNTTRFPAKALCALLAAAMLAGLAPANHIAAAVHDARLAAGAAGDYEFEAPQAQGAFPRPEIPPTFTFGFDGGDWGEPEAEPEEAQETAPAEPWDWAAALPATAAALAGQPEEDPPWLAIDRILGANGLYSDLGRSDLEALCRLARVEAGALAALEEAGLTLAESLPYAQAALEFGLDAAELHARFPALEDLMGFAAQARLAQALEELELPEGAGPPRGPGDEELVPEQYLGAPYSYDGGAAERVNMNTGALVYEAVDYVLPGVGGLDLVIGRRYDSGAANTGNPYGAAVATPVKEYYYINYKITGLNNQLVL